MIFVPKGGGGSCVFCQPHVQMLRPTPPPNTFCPVPGYPQQLKANNCGLVLFFHCQKAPVMFFYRQKQASGVGSFTSQRNQIRESAVRRDPRFFVLSIREN